MLGQQHRKKCLDCGVGLGLWVIFPLIMWGVTRRGPAEQRWKVSNRAQTEQRLIWLICLNLLHAHSAAAHCAEDRSTAICSSVYPKCFAVYLWCSHSCTYDRLARDTWTRPEIKLQPLKLIAKYNCCHHDFSELYNMQSEHIVIYSSLCTILASDKPSGSWLTSWTMLNSGSPNDFAISYLLIWPILCTLLQIN